MFVVTLSLLPTTAQTASTDEEQIRGVYERLISGCKAKDLDAIMKAYVANQSLLVFDALPPRQYVGAKAYREDWEGFLAFFGSPAKTVGGPGLLAALRIASKPPVNYR